MKAIEKLVEDLKSKIEDLKLTQLTNNTNGSHPVNKFKLEARFYTGFDNRKYPLYEYYFYVINGVVCREEMTCFPIHFQGKLIPAQYTYHPEQLVEEAIVETVNSWLDEN